MQLLIDTKRLLNILVTLDCFLFLQGLEEPRGDHGSTDVSNQWRTRVGGGEGAGIVVVVVLSICAVNVTEFYHELL